MTAPAAFRAGATEEPCPCASRPTPPASSTRRVRAASRIASWTPIDAGLYDPAVVIGLAAQFAQLGEAGSPLPEPLLQRLRRLADGGDPAARLMLRMLVGRGKAPRSALRPDAAAGADASPAGEAR